jgi:hypothetical protein
VIEMGVDVDQHALKLPDAKTPSHKRFLIASAKQERSCILRLATALAT